RLRIEIEWNGWQGGSRGIRHGECQGPGCAIQVDPAAASFIASDSGRAAHEILERLSAAVQVVERDAEPVHHLRLPQNLWHFGHAVIVAHDVRSSGSELRDALFPR